MRVSAPPSSSATYPANAAKALEVILWLANARPGIDLYHILECVFLAEVRHLNEHGRPIIGDAYRAAPYGPLGTVVYGLLRGDPVAVLALQGNADLPFRVEPRWRVFAEREANGRRLSLTDVSALRSALDQAGGMSFDELMEMTCDMPAYQSAAGGRIRYEDLLDDDLPRRQQIADELAYAAHDALL